MTKFLNLLMIGIVPMVFTSYAVTYTLVVCFAVSIFNAQR